MKETKSTRKIWYHEVYLRSKHWEETREKALEWAEHRCQICNSKESLNVHHNTYENLWNEKPRDLVVLCYTCHDRNHFYLKLDISLEDHIEEFAQRIRL